MIDENKGEKMKLSETKRAITELNIQIKNLLKESGFAEYNEFTPDEYSTNYKFVEDMDGFIDRVVDLSPDEWQLIHEYERILEKLDMISDSISYLNKPVTHEGKLYFTSRERYTVSDRELSCGVRVEYQRYDDEHDFVYWVTDRVEYSDSMGGYYFFRSKHPLQEGQLVRIRW